MDRACAPKAHVLCSADVSGARAFVVRLEEDGGARTTYHLKRYSEFKALDGKLRRAVSERGQCEAGTIAHVPELPTNGTFGFRHMMSKVGVGGFSGQQVEALHMYLAELLGQIRTLVASSELQDFFKVTAPEDAARLPEVLQKNYREEQQVLQDKLFKLRSRVTMQTIEGYWRLGGSDNIWLVEADGFAISCNHRGRRHERRHELTEFSIHSQRVIGRLDGWQIDMEKSSSQRLLWVNPVQPDRQHFVWVREDEAVAEAEFDKLRSSRLPAFTL